MDIIAGLQQLSLTEYEAKAYVALIKHPDSNGYELAKHSSVPRAKIYEVLDSLQRKGAILTSTTDGRQVHRALSYRDLLCRFQSSINRTVADLESELARVAQPTQTNSLYTVKGEHQTLQLAREMINSARTRLLLTGFPEDLTAILPELRAAEERGVTIHVLSFGNAAYGLKNVFTHSVTGAQYLQVAAFGRWLAIIRDNEESLLAQMRGRDESMGFRTSNEIVILGLSMWIYHDIQINVLIDSAPHRMLEDAMRITAPVQDIIFWESCEVPPIAVEPTWPTAQEVLERTRARLEYSRVPEDYGIYHFELSGEGGGSFELSVSAYSVVLLEGAVSPPDLTAKLSTSDFLAMAVGKLPLAAFTAKGRISVQGDLSLASNFQRLLR